MCSPARLVCLLTLLAAPAAAQSSTDGLHAMLRGDYQTSVRILRPLADAARPDPVAQFFLALLYDAGHAGGTNTRACGLFERAAVRTNPFAEQSSQLAGLLQEQLGAGASSLCIAHESWYGGPALSFVLGPGHQVVFADAAVRVVYGDDEQTVLFRPWPGAMLGPIRYTPLSVTRPIAARRHFFQWLEWVPDDVVNRASWTLRWTLSEVVGERWVPVRSEDRIATVNGPSVPVSDDLAKLVLVRLAASGEAEFAVIGGPAPRTEVIPSQGEPAKRPSALEARTAAAVGVFAGQTRTAEGVMALARGDYQTAVEILKPLAERARDIAAQFFMATLYETGRGVPVDPVRACALYMRAASLSGNPFGRAADRLFARSVARDREFNDQCQLLAVLGFDHGFEPVTFHLAPGHVVEWTLSAATVTYRGRTKRVPMVFALPGSRFLPLKHTELATGPTRSVTRHFIEMFVWRPAQQAAGWELHHHLLEVVGDEIVTIDTSNNPLATIEGETPPSRQSFEPREYAVVRVDEEGNVEWAILKGPHATTQRIESEIERREVREAAAVRDAALKRVDWSRLYDPTRPPTMAYVDADGCGHVQVYGWSADRAEAVVVRADGTARHLSTQPVTFDLSRDAASLSVTAFVFEAGQHHFSFCSDVSMPVAVGATGPETWSAIAGTVTIALSPEGVRARTPSLRRATVTMSNVVLRNTAGVTVRIMRTVTLTALVGSMFG